MTNNYIKKINDVKKINVVLAKLFRTRQALERAFNAIAIDGYKAFERLPNGEARRYTKAINSIIDKENHLLIRIDIIERRLAA